MEIPRKLALKVGVLAAVALGVGFVVLMLIGNEGSFLASTRTYHTAFNDVSGLREGAVVRLGGRSVGEVTEIAFGPLGDSEHALIVTFDVREGFAERIRADSRVTISSQGLLGDKLLDMSLGTATAPEVADGGWLAGVPPSDPARLIGAATAAAESARNILVKLDKATEGLDAGGALDEVRATSAAIRRLMDRVEQGPGLAHTLIYDEELAASTRRAVASLDRAAGAGAKTMTDARRVMDKLDTVVAAIDPHRLKSAVDDLSSVAADVSSVAADVRAGRGSLGGLLVDPTLYEETKRVLVNIRRNRVLKAVARLVISEDGSDDVMDAAPATVTIHPRSLTGGERENVSGRESEKR